METIAITAVESLIVGDIIALMTPTAPRYEVTEHKNETFGNGCTMALKSLDDGITRQANWNKGNVVSLLKTNFIPEVSDPYQGRTLSEMLATAI